MKRFNNAEAILALIFASNVPQLGMPSECEQDGYFLAIPGQFGPRWIVPACSHYGRIVLAQWHPYNFSSKIKWDVLRLAYAMGILGKFPGINLLHVEPRTTLQLTWRGTSFVPVVYVGTPGFQQKAVVTIVSPGNGEPRAIMKVAMGGGAAESMLREAKTLEKLSGTDVTGVPALLSVEESGNRTWQTVVYGDLTSRKLTYAHIDWLLELPKSERSTTLHEQQELLRNYFERNISLFGYHRTVVAAAIAAIQEGQIPLVLVHGDFAPWNLKRQADGNIAAIDWEDADWFGLPLWDLCHFFFMQAHLFKERSPFKMLSHSPLVQQYLFKLGIDKKYVAALVLLYILLTASGLKTSASEVYREFLLSQIPSVTLI